MENLTGKRFGKLVVISPSRFNDGRAAWLSKCDCGKTQLSRRNHLTSGFTTSCGCVALESHKKARLTHGHGRRGAKTGTYKKWMGMLRRCNNPNDESFARYGARGIMVCERWRSYESFLSDMGECPPGLTLDRIDNGRGYEPGNCRWASAGVQARNRSMAVMLTLNGETLNAVDWAARVGLKAATLLERKRDGWTDERAILTPARKQSRP